MNPKMFKLITLQPWNIPTVYCPVSVGIFLLWIHPECLLPCTGISQVVVQQNAVGVERDNLFIHTSPLSFKFQNTY